MSEWASGAGNAAEDARVDATPEVMRKYQVVTLPHTICFGQKTEPQQLVA